jgi:hypothetical protein
MRTFRYHTWIILLFAIFQWHCIQSYVSPYKSPTTGYLVVEGYITGNGPTSFRLTRTIPLPGDTTIPVVIGAHLRVEGSDNSVYPFTETGNGFYALPSITMNTTTQYRLRIANVNNENYLRDHIPLKPTPPIDSLNWVDADTGVIIYANTHDPTGTTRYYQWKYSETWEYTGSEPSGWIFQGDTLAMRPDSLQFYVCYRTDTASDIVLGTSEKLAQDVIYKQPVIIVPRNTQRLDIEYSALISQYALTDSAFDYLTLLQSNSENLGSIMAPMPSQFTGNIHCLTNPNEPVIGFISAGTLQQQRILISRNQVPNWLYFYACSLPDKIIPEIPDSMTFYFDYLGYVPISIPNDNQVRIGFAKCVDCILQGGTTTKPTFFP